jgi:hypothetical protein
MEQFLLSAVSAAEPLVPEPGLSEVDIAIATFKRYKSMGIDKIPAELIETGGETS